MKSRRKKFTTMHDAGKKPITFRKGALHRAVGVPAGAKIPGTKMVAARAGHYGKKAQKEARFAGTVLSKGRATAKKKK